MDKLTYPFKVMHLSQDYTQGNHLLNWYGSKDYYDYPIDERCEDRKRSPMYAPVDLKVINLYGVDSTMTNTVVLETIDLVQTPIGNKKVTITATHLLEDELKMIYVGQMFKKGSIICHEGNDGEATGNHIHMTVCQNFKGIKKNSNGNWCFIGDEQYRPEDIFYIDEDFTKVVNHQTINWVKLLKNIGIPANRNTSVDQIEVKVDNLRGRSEPAGKILGYINKGIYNILGQDSRSDYIWYEIEDNIWIAYNEQWEDLLLKRQSFFMKIISWIIRLFKR